MNDELKKRLKAKKIRLTKNIKDSSGKTRRVKKTREELLSELNKKTVLKSNEELLSELNKKTVLKSNEELLSELNKKTVLKSKKKKETNQQNKKKETNQQNKIVSKFNRNKEKIKIISEIGSQIEVKPGKWGKLRWLVKGAAGMLAFMKTPLPCFLVCVFCFWHRKRYFSHNFAQESADKWFNTWAKDFFKFSNQMIFEYVDTFFETYLNSYFTGAAASFVYLTAKGSVIFNLKETLKSTVLQLFYTAKAQALPHEKLYMIYRMCGCYGKTKKLLDNAGKSLKSLNELTMKEYLQLWERDVTSKLATVGVFSMNTISNAATSMLTGSNNSGRLQRNYPKQINISPQRYTNNFNRRVNFAINSKPQSSRILQMLPALLSIAGGARAGGRLALA
jgi:hypothetical protein